MAKYRIVPTHRLMPVDPVRRHRPHLPKLSEQSLRCNTLVKYPDQTTAGLSAQSDPRAGVVSVDHALGQNVWEHIVAAIAYRNDRSK